ncbi:MAG TPA: DoxX family membrane protein [Chitinophagaceae bacterium]|nr:DoxX family membrane protein [Chitinophagaceae bacterium]
MKRFFSAQPLAAYNTLTGVFRIIIGIFCIYHGWEVFSSEPIATYTGWLTDKHFPSPQLWAYLGKGTELIGGILLLLGLLTRLITIPLMCTMLFIIFVLGHGKIFYEDQYPFLFFMFFVYFFFAGPGKWSFDKLVFKRSKLSAQLQNFFSAKHSE